MKKYSIKAVSQVQTDWIEKNYETLKETYLRKGYDSKIIFAIYCIQKFEEAYSEYETKKIQQQERFTHDESF